MVGKAMHEAACPSAALSRTIARPSTNPPQPPTACPIRAISRVVMPAAQPRPRWPQHRDQGRLDEQIKRLVPDSEDASRSGFSDACQTQTRGGARRQASEKPRGRKPRGSSHRRWCRSMGNLPALLDLICRFRTGRRLSDQPGAGFGRPGWDRRGDLVFGALGFVGRSWCRGSLSATRGRCR